MWYMYMYSIRNQSSFDAQVLLMFHYIYPYLYCSKEMILHICNCWQDDKHNILQETLYQVPSSACMPAFTYTYPVYTVAIQVQVCVYLHLHVQMYCILCTCIKGCLQLYCWHPTPAMVITCMSCTVHVYNVQYMCTMYMYMQGDMSHDQFMYPLMQSPPIADDNAHYHLINSMVLQQHLYSDQCMYV